MLELRAYGQAQTLSKECKFILRERAQQTEIPMIRIQTDVIARKDFVLRQPIADAPDQLVAFSQADVVLEIEVVNVLMVEQ
jgi:hypothetical protein